LPVDRDNLGYLLAKASQRWNELLHADSSRSASPRCGRPTAHCSCPCSRRTGCVRASSRAGRAQARCRGVCPPVRSA